MGNHNEYSLALLSYKGLNSQMNYMKSIYMQYKDFVEDLGYIEQDYDEGRYRLWFMKIPILEWDYVWQDNTKPKSVEDKTDCIKE